MGSGSEEAAADDGGRRGGDHRRCDEVHVIDPVRIDQVIDSTGAGDAYAGGFLYALTHGFDLAACGRMGSIAAAEVISHFGARPETPLGDLIAAAGG